MKQKPAEISYCAAISSHRAHKKKIGDSKMLRQEQIKLFPQFSQESWNGPKIDGKWTKNGPKTGLECSKNKPNMAQKWIKIGQKTYEYITLKKGSNMEWNLKKNHRAHEKMVIQKFFAKSRSNYFLTYKFCQQKPRAFLDHFYDSFVSIKHHFYVRFPLARIF